jgi:hypothetical protein
MRHSTLIKITCGVLGCVLLGCAPAGWTSMPDRDRQTFLRCRQPLQAMQCGRLDVDLCTMEMIERYSEQPTTPTRLAWLRAHGCPPAMVEPGDL